MNDIDLDKTLEQVSAFVERFVVFPLREQVVAITLWVAHTYAIEAADTTPYLSIESAEKRSGKSLLLDVLDLLVRMGWQIISPSEAVLYRKTAADHPTLLLDEVDAIFNPKASNYEPQRALLNAGHRRGASVPRCVGEGKNIRVENFDVFCAKALAGIGSPPDTVRDRSIPISLKRRSKSEKVERFRYRDAQFQAADLRDALERWAQENVGQLRDARPDLPEALNDRAADAWEPLLAIADAAGEKWSASARLAAVALSAAEETDQDSHPLRLLADARTAFGGRGTDRLWTADLIATLVEMEESPWGDFYGRQISAHGVARLLKRYSIRPALLRIGEEVKRGYLRDHFIDAWNRYLDPLPPSSQEALKRYSVTSGLEDALLQPSRNVVTLKPPSSEGGGGWSFTDNGRACAGCGAYCVAVDPDGVVRHPTCPLVSSAAVEVNLT